LAYILREPAKVARILEIGMGTNNKDVVSHMGSRGQPGASLRAFRDFLPNANVYGADFDKRILFNEGRIETYFVDQNDPETLSYLSNTLPEDFDLIIDDGLHAPHANIAVLTMALPKLKSGGWFLIEDIADEAVPVWQVVSHMMQQDYSAHIVQALGSIVFAVQRLPESASGRLQ
jgi:SAM-dependent methyltransferase